MTYGEKIILEDTHIELSEFCAQSREWHAVIHTSRSCGSLANQIASLRHGLLELLAMLPSTAVAMFARCHVSDAANQTQQLRQWLSPLLGCPLSIIQQPPLDGTKATLWVYLVDNGSSRTLPDGTYAVEHGTYTHLWRTDIGEANGNSYMQTKTAMENYARILEDNGCTLADNCLRTWLFVRDIDNNYSGVVRARNDVFALHGLNNDTHFIASTGIDGSSGQQGVLLSMDTYAVRGLREAQVRHLYAASHMNRTSDYGVSFERGTAIEYGDRIHALISGTASIDNRGQIMHPGDIKRQTERMWENISTLLDEAGMDMDADIASMDVYLRDMADYATVRKLFEERFPQHPKNILLAPVCRPGWLIEMECMAVKAHNSDFPVF
ncbi:MAG: Rid family hydrolase [Prevotella sp.]